VKVQQLLTSVGIVVGTTTLAFGTGLVASSWAGSSTAVASAAAAAILSSAWVLRLPEGIAAFGISVLLADTVQFWSGVEFRYLDEITIILVALAVATWRRSSMRRSAPGIRATSLLVFALAAIASSLVNDVPAGVWLPALLLVGKGYVFFYLVALAKIEPDALPRVVAPVFVVALAIAAIGVAQFVGGDTVRDLPFLPPYGAQRAGITVVTSLFSHPAIFGWITVYVALFLMARFAVLRDRGALALAMLLSPASLLSGRRTPIVGLLAGVAVLALRQISTGWTATRRLLPVLGVLAVGILVALPLLGRLYDFTVDEYGEPPALVAEVFDEHPDSRLLRDMAPRNALYFGSIAIARDHVPLGAGLGRFGSHMSRESYSPVYAEYGLERIYGLSERYPIAITDTYWPMLLGETGVVGLLAIVTFMASLGRQLWFAARRVEPPAVRAFALGALLVFVDGLVRSLTSGVFAAPPIAYFVFGAAALAVALDDGRDSGADRLLIAEARPPAPQ
jgi:hypothetical protein